VKLSNEDIKKLALENGFKLKEQPIGELDLNHYVYDFANSIFAFYESKIEELNSIILEELENRDRWEERASKLAYAVGEYFGESVGEHSSANCPIKNAHELLIQI
jgi:hypothetical protein